MSLIAAGYNTEPEPPAPLENNGFWPPVDPADFRQAERIAEAITPARVEVALSTAMADINRQLRAWQAEQQAAGAVTIADVAPPGWQAPGVYGLLYRRAVYATALASLLERYRDASATSEGDERGEAKDFAADDARRDARWAVAEIQNRNHTVVELI
ncbi:MULTISPECIES: head completion/stabilization protein [Halomonas]|uniref:head completion/stabilization protein n=1 Tax=Halomonas TaxID=2745 RepID=UPI001C988AB7|nr:MULTISPECIES: head completion/stabilization protein [Halomonas]MBY6206879.1 head completion/stabilization protein [Halomonas sp. DP3Y7-2]MBY6230353.1 head completion/stabilization protein [Halomonas sp. DP3Y7-1]MCA0918514.1 head completion/stabilization protein [Halomonas denitrificans]